MYVQPVKAWAAAVAASFGVAFALRWRVRQPGLGRGDDIRLRVVANPEGKQLHHLPSEVLVRIRLLVGGGVEPQHHGAVLGDCLGESLEAARPRGPEQLVLEIHELGVANLGRSRREVAVPEEGQLLPQRGGCDDHPIEPPQLQRDQLLVNGAICCFPGRQCFWRPLGCGWLLVGREDRHLDRVAGGIGGIPQTSQHLLDRGFIACPGPLIELVGMEAKPGPTVEQRNVAADLIRHLRSIPGLPAVLCPPVWVRHVKDV